MLQDRGQKVNLGFGMPLQDVEEGQGNSNAIQKALGGHPVMRFFATAAASIAAMGMAGRIVQKGGLRFAHSIQQVAEGAGENAQLARRGIHAFRRIEDIMDSLEGLDRQLVDPNNPFTLVKDLNAGKPGARKRLVRDTTTVIDSFNMRLEDDSIAAWTVRDSLQQRLVKQARRLPYEAPGFYVAQKTILDPLFGDNKDPKKRVNWHNPFDVVGDFSYQTLKNLTLNVLPFEVGIGATKTAYSRYALKALEDPGQGNLGVLSAQSLLRSIGIDFSDLMDQTIKRSQQSLGAFAASIKGASENSYSMRDWLKTRQNAALVNSPEYANSGYAKRLFMQAQDVTTVVGPNGRSINRKGIRSAVDILPAPFKGMGSGLSRGKEAYKTIGQTYDDWQNVVSGNMRMRDLLNDPADGLQRHRNLENYIRKGAGTHLENVATASWNWGKGGPLLPNGKQNPDWKGGQFFQTRSDQFYRELLSDELSSRTGLKLEEVSKFVSTAHNVSSYKRGGALGAGEGINTRFTYTSNGYHGTDMEEWWQGIVGSASRHKTFSGQAPTLKQFQESMRGADLKFTSSNFESDMQGRIAQEWKTLHSTVFPQTATQALSTIKKPFEQFSGANLQANQSFILQRTAHHLGISTTDAAGKALPTQQVAQAIQGRGLNPNNLKKLRGFLMDKKDIASPWSMNASNIFGFKPLNLNQAVQNQFFGRPEPGIQREINHFVNQDRFNQWDLKLNKAFVGPNGKIFDLGRIGRSAMGILNKSQSEIQIPLIKIKPLQAGGWTSFESMRNTPAIAIAPGDSIQPVALAGVASETPNFYLWSKTSARSSKGRLSGVSGDISNGITVRNYEGLYRPFTTNVQNMLGKYGQILLSTKDNPRQDIPSSQSQQGWRKLFNVSRDQENNLFMGRDSVIGRWGKGLRKNGDALANPFIAAERFAKPGFNPASMTATESKGFESLITTLRGYGFSAKTLKELSDDPEFSSIFNLNLGGNTPENILNIQENLLPRVIKRVLDQDRKSLAGTPNGEALGRLQQNLSNLLSQGDKQLNFWDLTAPETVRMTGISRRIDQLRGEFFDYLMVRPPSNNAVGVPFDDTVHKLLGKLEQLHMTGAISKAERAEGRAAILSLQMERARNQTYEPGKFLSEHNRSTLTELFNSGTEINKLLSEVGSGVTNHPTSFFKRQASQLGRSAPYERPDQINPLGTDQIFMPTFRTTFDRNPGRALLGLGLSRDPRGISGSSIPAEHLVGRLNRYFENFGIGLDETQYKSPLGMYAKGLVGQRALPIYAAGATALAVDRTIGGAVNEDSNGDPVYAPFFLGKAASVLAAGQVGMAGLIPGGQTGSEKRRELESGEVPIRKGRYWMLGNTPWKGGRIQYFRPSWYRRMQSGGAYTPETNETPLERLAFGQDFSPLRPFDPYRREREDSSSRPYPLTGDYFTGPWGPVTGALNATVGRVLKPRRRMHEEETKYILGQYSRVGQEGAFFSQTPILSDSGSQLASINAGYESAGVGTPSSAPFYGSMGYAAPRGRASQEVRQRATNIAASYSAIAQTPGSYLKVGDSLVPYGVPSQAGMMNPRVIAAGQPLDYGSTSMSARRFAYQAQEAAGIYGFAQASVRESLGFGSKDLTPTNAVLEPASRGYSASRSFWNMQIGGIGDFPLPIGGKFSNLELSEIVRRFVPKDPAGTNYINSIPNDLGKQFPWLPGTDYPLANIKGGDPYNAIPDAEIRLPGTGYARINPLYSDQYGKLGLANIHDILGDIAPWSQQYKQVNALVDKSNLSENARAKVMQTRAQVEAMRYENEFTPYKHKYDSVVNTIENPTSSGFGKAWEWLTHRDTYLNTKLGAPRTAVEDWERDNVYGSTFPSWENPIESFIKPALYKATQRNVFSAAAGGASLGYLFGAGAEAKTIGAVVGGLATAASSIYGSVYKQATGERFIPLDRRKQAALEEYSDIFEYTRSTRAAAMAQKAGDTETAKALIKRARGTMYGMDFNSVTPEQLAMAVPNRKREHFRAMMYAPIEEYQEILSTAPRLERRLLQAAWGMPVEEKPDLREYYQNHELPPPDAAVWSPMVSQDTLKIKMGQHLGLDMAQMGYYPQQVQEANLINPAYPNLNQKSGFFGGFSIRGQLKRMLMSNNIDGDVLASPSPFPGNQVQYSAGVF